jgi:hypothetical protein
VVTYKLQQVFNADPECPRNKKITDKRLPSPLLHFELDSGGQSNDHLLKTFLMKNTDFSEEYIGEKCQ